MKIKANIISGLIGVAIGSVATLTIAAASSSEPSSYGRFQLLAADGYLFKIDTATGQAWRSLVNTPSDDFMRSIYSAPLAPAQATRNSTSGLEKNAQK